MVQAAVPPLDLVDGVREAMARVDAGIPIFNVSTMEATLDDAMARERFARAFAAREGLAVTL